MLIYQIILFLPEKCAKVDRGLKPHNFEGREKGEIRSKSPLEGKTESAYFFSRVKHTSSPFSISIYSSDSLFSATSLGDVGLFVIQRFSQQVEISKYLEMPNSIPIRN